MACFVSISFSVPLCSIQNPLKGSRYPKKSAFCRLRVLTTPKAASYFLAPCSSNKGVFSVCGQRYPTTLSKHFDETVSCSFSASPCTRIHILGYWVGPDIDDGWGFVEAFIDRNT
ncbi:hypothetical protein PTKIN_Ptkin06aG0208800 [Pterospermum kingtungense]